MKYIAIVLLSIGLILSTGTAHAEDQGNTDLLAFPGTPLTFPDTALAAAVRAALGLPNDAAITQDVLNNMTDLFAWNSNISDLTGLEHATALEILNVSENSISDLSPLSGLTNLKLLELGLNRITDITPLANLTALTELDLAENAVQDITSLQNLTALERLQLRENKIENISPLSNLTALEFLGLIRNQVTDITVLTHLTQLKQFYIGENRITDITPLQNLTALGALHIQGNQITDITHLQKLTALEYLNVSENQVSNIKAVKELTKLVVLDLSRNQISDVETLEGLTSLLFLYIRGNPITDYEPLRTLKAANPDVWIDVDLTDPAAGAPGHAPPAQTVLLSNYPNPCNPETWIPYQLAKAADVTVTIYDMRGVRVREFALGYQPAGVHRSRARAVHWNGLNDFGEKVASGVYFYTLTAGEFTATRKLLIRK